VQLFAIYYYCLTATNNHSVSLRQPAANCCGSNNEALCKFRNDVNLAGNNRQPQVKCTYTVVRGTFYSLLTFFSAYMCIHLQQSFLTATTEVMRKKTANTPFSPVLSVLVPLFVAQS
jgi:hypothetical protein